MRYRICLALALLMATLLPTSARAQGVAGLIESFPAVNNTTIQSWQSAETHFWTLNTDQDPAAVATWPLNVPQSGGAYGLFVLIPAPVLQETRPRTNRATYEIRAPGGGVTQFFLNQTVNTAQWVSVPTSSLTFDQPGTYQLALTGKTNDPAGTTVVVASAVRLVPGLDPGTPGGGLNPQLEVIEAQRAFDLINQLRAQAGVPLLNRDLRLDRAEAGHVLDMAANNFVSSDSRDGLSASGRASRQGYSPRDLTVWISVGEATADELMKDFPRDILNPIYTDAGVALAFAPGSPHVYYWSIVVATR